MCPLKSENSWLRHIRLFSNSARVVKQNTPIRADLRPIDLNAGDFDLAGPCVRSSNELSIVLGCWLETTRLEFTTSGGHETVLIHLRFETEDPADFEITSITTDIEFLIQGIFSESDPNASESSQNQETLEKVWIPFKPSPERPLEVQCSPQHSWVFRSSLLSEGGGYGSKARWIWRARGRCNVLEQHSSLYAGVAVKHNGHPFLIKHHVEGQLRAFSPHQDMSFEYHKPYKFSTQHSPRSILWKLDPMPSAGNRNYELLKQTLEDGVNSRFRSSLVAQTNASARESGSSTNEPPPAREQAPLGAVLQENLAIQQPVDHHLLSRRMYEGTRISGHGISILGDVNIYQPMAQ